MPIIPQNAIFAVDVLQVGSSTPGSDIVVTVRGEVIKSSPQLSTLGNMPRAAIRAQTNPMRANPQVAGGIQALAAATQELNKNADVLAEQIEKLDTRVIQAANRLEYATFVANLQGAQAVASNLVPWPPAIVAAWNPVEAWITAKTAPVGADLIVDVKWSADTSVQDAPVWTSIFPSGQELRLADGANRRLKPWTVFA